MAFNFLSFCNNEKDTSTISGKATGKRQRINTYSKLEEEALQEKEDEIARLKVELDEEQARCEKLEESNELLTKQVKQLKQQLMQYIEDNNSAQEVQYDQAKLEELLQEKSEHLARVENDYAQSQEKVAKLRDQLEQSKHLLQTETAAHQLLQKQMQQFKQEYDTSIESYKAQLDQQMQQFEDLQKKYRYI